MDQKEIWEQLVSKQYYRLSTLASNKYLEGRKKLDLLTMPLIEDISIPHWKIQPIVGKSPEDIFWYRLSKGIFNVNMNLRTEGQIDYLEERDLFHDTFGHLPILYDNQYSDYVRGLGNFAMHMKDNAKSRRVLSNVYWFTSEFGLVNEPIHPLVVLSNPPKNQVHLKAYGAGILSSNAELTYAFSSESKKYVFGETTGFDFFRDENPYITNGFQQHYLVIEWRHLSQILKWLWANFV